MTDNNNHMIERREWNEFRDAGLIWWCNRILHLFGWAIALEFDDDGKIKEVYPTKCKFRGFNSETETAGFEKLTRHLSDNMPNLLQDIKE